MSSFIVDYPFADRVYPGTLEVIEHFGKLGPTVILSDGDVVFSRVRSSAQDCGTRSGVEYLSMFIKRVCWITSNSVIQPGTT
jgi:hypothetical protein